jgi:hypothetical protein
MAETSSSSSSSTSTNIFESRRCSTPGCGKAATLKCPTCNQKGLPDSFFCSQDCFKSGWALHKLVHLGECHWLSASFFVIFFFIFNLCSFFFFRSYFQSSSSSHHSPFHAPFIIFNPFIIFDMSSISNSSGSSNTSEQARAT